MTSVSRRSALRAAAAFGAGFTMGTIDNVVAANAAEVDPIFAAIERSVALYDDYMAAYERIADMKLSDPAFAPLEEDAEARMVVHDDHLRELLQTVPTTLPGVAAYLELLRHRGAYKWDGLPAAELNIAINTLKAAVTQQMEA
ncbi:MAG: hypothetical protein U1E62_12025 [Alsobacter sp.]